LIIAAMLIPRMHRFDDYLGAHMIAGIDILGTVFLVWVYGRDSHIVQYYSLSAVLLFVFGIENWRRYTGWFVLAAVCLLAALLLAPKEGLFVPQDHLLREIMAAQTLRRLAIPTVLLLAAMFAIIVPFAKHPLGNIPALILSHLTAVAIIDLLTAG